MWFCGWIDFTVYTISRRIHLAFSTYRPFVFWFCSRFTYEIAPVFVLMEQLTLKKMREIIGWPDGEGDGIFSPGKRPIYEPIRWGTVALNL